MSISPFRTPEAMNKRKDNKVKGNSTGKAMSSNGGQTELPHYLRASSGSCHDLCKYGRKHASEEKPWKRSKVKITVKKLPDDMNEALSSASSETKKKKQLLDSSNGDSDIIKRRVVKLSAGGGTSLEQRDSPQKKNKTTNHVSVSQISENKQKVMSGRATPTSKETKRILGQAASMVGKKDSDVKVIKKIGSSKFASKKVSVTPRASFSPKSSIRLTGNSNPRKSQSLKKVSSSPANQKLSDVQCDDEPRLLQNYPVHVVEIEAKNYKTAEEDDLDEQCTVEPSPPPPSSSSTQKDEDLGEYEEYTISETEEYEYPSGSNKTESGEEEEERKSTRVEARKLHFRRGKEVDVNGEKESPRRLKFRHGRDLGENPSENENGRRSFKRREKGTEEKDDDSEEKVVLRHQDVQDKKEAQGLFNNVIEETASKLVESQKSKVKALVGAFETVISLQESKPSTNST